MDLLASSGEIDRSFDADAYEGRRNEGRGAYGRWRKRREKPGVWRDARGDYGAWHESGAREARASEARGSGSRAHEGRLANGARAGWLESRAREDWLNAAHDSRGDGGKQWRDTRPYLPPLFFLALSLWAGDALAIEVWFGVASVPVAVVAFAAALAIIVGLLLVRRARALIGCLILGLALGFLLGSTQAWIMGQQQEELLANNGKLVCEITRDSQESSYGASALARTETGAKVRIGLPSGTRLLVGDRIVVGTEWREPSESSAQSSWRDGIVATTTVKVVNYEGESEPRFARDFRRAAVDALCDYRDTQQRGDTAHDAILFLTAIICGYTDGLHDSAFYQTIKVCGLAHMVAVSGAHLVIVCGFITLLLRRLPLGRSIAIGCQLAFLFSYLIFTGMPISALRAGCMSFFALVSFFAGRRPYALGGLSACVVLFIATDPSAAFSVSFLLSTGATAGIVVFSNFFKSLFQASFHMPDGFVRDALALTFSSSLVTSPICAFVFGQISIISPLVNVVATPVFPFACIGGFVALGIALLIPALAPFALGVMTGVLQLFVLVMDVAASLPFAATAASFSIVAVCVFSLGIPALIWLFWPYPGRLFTGAIVVASMVAICFSFCSPLLKGETLSMLDVGQGDAILLQSRGHAVLVDTGKNDADLLRGLAAAGVTSLDALIITHPDDDHCGSLSALRGIVQVKRVLVARDVLQIDNANCASLRREASALVGEENLLGVVTGNEISFGAMRLEVVGPRACTDEGGNADSVVMTLRWGNASGGALLTGDAEAEVLEGYMREGRIRDIDILKVAHHGSRAALDEELLAQLDPEVALISVGAGNRYGHPTEEILQLLEDAGDRVFRTDLDGTVTCSLRDDGIGIRTQG